jgi:phenylacetate-CoA oxygenase PaaI subunit
MSEASLYQNVEELETAVAVALRQWIMALADTKHRLGIRTSEWVNGTPALEGAVGASAITQDELGHARSYYSVLRYFPGVPEAIGFENDLEARDVYYNPRQLNASWASWLDVIAANVLLDRALQLAVAATRTSCYGPLQTRSAKVLQEESYHRIFGDSWLARIAARQDKVTGKLQDSLDKFWGTAVAWIGPDDDPITHQLVTANILNSTPAMMRQQWLNEVTSLLQKHGLTVPDGEPDWTKWNSEFRDLP